MLGQAGSSQSTAVSWPFGHAFSLSMYKFSHFYLSDSTPNPAGGKVSK